MEKERKEFHQRIRIIRSKIHSIRRQYNGEPEPGEDKVSKKRKDRKDADLPDIYSQWDATVKINGHSIPITNASFTISASNEKGSSEKDIKLKINEKMIEDINNLKLVGASDKSITEFIEEATKQEDGKEIYPHAVTYDKSK